MNIQLKVSILGGKYITNKNAHLIRAESNKIGCHCYGFPGIPDPQTYREVWRIKKDHWPEFRDGKLTGKKKKGYSFVEINHGGGMGGTQSSVRNLILAASVGVFGHSNITIIYEGQTK